MRKFAWIIVVIFLISILSVNVSAAEADTKVNSILSEATEYNGNYYLLIKGDYTWDQAKTYCEGLGGHLATVTSQGEDDICYQLWKNSGAKACWLGATDAELEGVWKWITHENWNYSNWGGNEPNGGTGENVLNYYGDYSDGRWNDSAADDEFPFICEWEQENIDYVRKTYGYVSSSGMIYNNSFYYNGHVYNIFNYEMTWDEAVAYCEKIGGHMAVISSADENKALFSYVTSRNSYKSVFGATDREHEGLWEWINGETMSYANWGDGEPNNSNGREHYVHFLSTFNGQWNDTTWDNSFICEWDNCCILSDGRVTEHSFGEDQTIKNATCTTKGQIKRICNGCGVEVTEDVAVIAHKYDDWKITTEATCHNKGESTRSCKDCGKTETQQIGALTHQWGEWLVTKAATCHASGLNERFCTLCGDKEQQTIEQLTHDYSDYVIVSGNKLIPPIVREKTCNLCDDVQTYEDWSNVWITIVAGIAIVGVIIGLVNYVRAFKKR